MSDLLQIYIPVPVGPQPDRQAVGNAFGVLSQEVPLFANTVRSCFVGR